jgi:hypothetical protein
MAICFFVGLNAHFLDFHIFNASISAIPLILLTFQNGNVNAAKRWHENFST